jgi:hypothetical protein
MTALELTAITDLLLAGEAFLAAGFLLGRVSSAPSAALFWALGLFCMGLVALLGGLDHGFFEPKGDTRARKILKKAVWLCTGPMTLCIWMFIAFQFAGPELRLPILAVGLAQLAVFCYLAIRRDAFLVVILNYAPVALILLVLNVAGLANGSSSWPIVAGLLISIAASAAQALGVDRFSPLDRNGLYHVLMIPAVLLFFWGGLSLLE